MGFYSREKPKKKASFNSHDESNAAEGSPFIINRSYWSLWAGVTLEEMLQVTEGDEAMLPAKP